jgi:hypothetical protein
MIEVLGLNVKEHLDKKFRVVSKGNHEPMPRDAT